MEIQVYPLDRYDEVGVTLELSSAGRRVDGGRGSSSDEDRGAVRAAWQALARREQIDPEARLKLYADLATHLRRIGRIPDELVDGFTDEQQVRNVVDVLYREQV